ASVVLIAIPGPSVLFVIGRSLALGWKGGVLTVLGNACGQLLQVAAVALGIGVVVAQSVILFSVVKFAGAAYLIYLGIQAIRHRRNYAVSTKVPVLASPWRLVGQGAVVGATNPKSVVFFVAVLPQFVD
ncbi:LysE family translocator, partial [Escherichia coli]|uniref:LysE family translocator n=1 Tax=Escherichia coli TaxID=562 RepID=UPI0032E389D2